MIRKRLMTEINLASLKSKDSIQSYFYSEDFQDILTNTLEQKYGGSYVCHQAARCIQRAYRQYRLRQRQGLSTFYETKSVHYRNNSMPDNLHYLNNYDDIHSSNECLNNQPKVYPVMRNLQSSKIKDSLSLLLPELQTSSMTRSSLSESSNTETDNVVQDQVLFDSHQFKIGDILSTKCEEDLENFQNGSVKTDSTEDSDSCSEKQSSFFHDSTIVVKLPPPMPVISTSILTTKFDKKLKSKKNIFSFDKSQTNNNNSKNDDIDNNALKPFMSSRIVFSSNVGVQFTRSPRDSGVSSHSSNTDLLTFEYPGQQSDGARGLYPQRPQSAISPGASRTHITVTQSSTQKDVASEHNSIIDSYIPPISEDTDSLFDSSTHPIPSVMTSSKDSGVDADSLTNQPGHLRRLSFQDKPNNWKLFYRQSCFTGCTAPANTVLDKDKIESRNHSSPWLKNSIDELESTSSINHYESECKEIVNKVIYRVAVNLFNRNTAVGLKFMDDHHLFNVRCPIEIANFLRSREVNLQVLAEFISCRNSVFHLQVLRCFLQNMSLQNLSFLEAFDLFISSFKLPEDSIRINYLISQFCQYYNRHVQRCSGIDLGALMGLSRIIILLKSSVIRSRLLMSNCSVLSFPDFVKNIQNCFKGQRAPYNMEMLQKIYISITRSNTANIDLAENLINRIGNIDECKPKSFSSTSKICKTSTCSGYLQQLYRRLTYCCDVQQSDVFGKKLKKKEHLRSIFVFNDTVVVAKRLSRTSAKQSKLFRTDSKFQCKMIINLLNYRVSKTSSPTASYQISVSPCGELSKSSTESSNPMFFICDSESSRNKLLSKINMSQLESQCVEQLRLQQWNCVHERNIECLCLAVINPVLSKINEPPHNDPSSTDNP